MKLNNVFKVLSKFFNRVFCSFSLITVAMAVVGSLIGSDELSKYMSVNQILTFFAFSLLFALSFGIADLIKENAIIRRCIQFVLTYLSLVAVFFLGGTFENYVKTNGIQNVGFSVLAISFVFVIIYVIVGVIVSAFGLIRKKTSESDKEYKSIFEKNE